MANRFNNQFRHSFEKKVVDIFSLITFGASGAPTITYSKGLTSVARGNTGLYVFKYNDSFNRSLIVDLEFNTGGIYAAGATAGVEGGTSVAAPAAPGYYVIKNVPTAKGGFGIVKTVSSVAGDVLTLAGVAFTAIAHGGTPTGNQWAVGNTDAASAQALASIINAATDAAITAAGISAVCVANNVVITATKLQASMAVSFAAGVTLTLTPAAATTGGPGLVLQLNSAGTAADPASGEVAKFQLTFNDSTAI